MKVALVHELLTMKGGAERVLKVLARLFPDAPIYTLLYDEKKLGDWFPPTRVRTSPLQKIATHYSLLTTHSFNHHLYLKKFPAAVENWDFSDFDLVISNSSAFTHGILTNGKPKHLCYVESPARYLWDRTHDVQERAARGFLGPLKRHHLSRTFHPLRLWDAEVAPRPDKLLTSSKEVQRRIQLYWNRESTVLYPPIDDFWFMEAEPKTQNLKPKTYFLVVSTLVPYKRLDIAVEACTKGNISLIIAGDGPDRKRLMKMAGPTVQCVGRQELDALKTLYTNAQATLFVGHEDFGLVPLESMACGTPVIAYQAGGALETVIEGETGTFFEEQTADCLLNTIAIFDHKDYRSESCISQAKLFTIKNYEFQLRMILKEEFDIIV